MNVTGEGENWSEFQNLRTDGAREGMEEHISEAKWSSNRAERLIYRTLDVFFDRLF